MNTERARQVVEQWSGDYSHAEKEELVDLISRALSEQSKAACKVIGCIATGEHNHPGLEPDAAYEMRKEPECESGACGHDPEREPCPRVPTPVSKSDYQQQARDYADTQAHEGPEHRAIERAYLKGVLAAQSRNEVQPTKGVQSNDGRNREILAGPSEQAQAGAIRDGVRADDDGGDRVPQSHLGSNLGGVQARAEDPAVEPATTDNYSGKCEGAQHWFRCECGEVAGIDEFPGAAPAEESRAAVKPPKPPISDEWYRKMAEAEEGYDTVAGSAEIAAKSLESARTDNSAEHYKRDRERLLEALDKIKDLTSVESNPDFFKNERPLPYAAALGLIYHAAKDAILATDDTERAQHEGKKDG